MSFRLFFIEGFLNIPLLVALLHFPEKILYLHAVFPFPCSFCGGHCGGMMQVDAVSVHSWVSCSLSSKAIGGISTSGSLLVSALLVWQCLMRSATLTSIPVISSHGLSWTVFLIPCLISWISTLSVLAIRSAKTLEMIAFSVLVKDRFVEGSSLARSHC